MTPVRHSQASIFLYGPSGAGKTTLGKILADNLGLPFVDLDEEITTRAGQPIPEIFSTRGESQFRKLESEVLRGVLAAREQVISLGGGALTISENRQLAEQHGRVLLVTAEADTLLTRLVNDSANPRPLIEGDAEAKLNEYLARRTPHYDSFEMQLPTTGLSPEEAAWQAQILLGMYQVTGMGAPYDVRIRSGGLDALGEALQQTGLHGPVALVTDSQVGSFYSARTAASLQAAGYAVQTITIPPGEAHKNIETVQAMWTGFLEGGLERRSTVVAMGGGVIGDLAGFAASTYLRGVPWVVVPTSLLAMVDASMGGKTGTDLPQGKNLVGAFHAPRLVYTDPVVISTLPRRELVSGMAEVIKHGIIADPELFEMCKSLSMWEHGWAEGVSRAMAVKIRIIVEDPYEQGLRESLNLGHTVGHTVELASGFAISHGESVAIGMVAEARLAVRLGLADARVPAEIVACLQAAGLPTEIPPEFDQEILIKAMSRDKKKSAGKVRFALPVKIGEVKTGVQIDDLRLALG